MAVYHIDTSAATDGDGTESAPFNTTVGRTWGTGHHWGFKRGTFIREYLNITGTAADLTFEPYGDGAFLPTFDCEGVRPTALNTNSKAGVVVQKLRFINQNSSASGALSFAGGLGVNGIGQDCEFENCRLSIGIASAPSTTIRRMKINAGNTNEKSVAYGVRIYGATATGSVLEDLEIWSTAGLTYGTGIEITANAATVRRARITAYACDGILARTGSTGHVIESTLIAGDMKDLLALENSHDSVVRNVTLWQTGALGDTYPCIKLGNDFGAGSPADNNSFRNVMAYSGAALPLVIQNGGANNDIDFVRLARSGSTLLMRNDVFGGPTAQFLNLAQMQAAGYNANGAILDAALVTAQGIPLPNSPLLTQGADLGWRRDIRGFQSRKHIGAYGAARLIAV